MNSSAKVFQANFIIHFPKQVLYMFNSHKKKLRKTKFQHNSFIADQIEPIRT